MSSQGSNRNKHFSQDIAFNSYTDVLVKLQNETTLIKRLRYVEVLISRYVPTVSQSDLESEILHCLMPCIKDLQQSIFEDSIQVVLDNSEQMCKHALRTIKEYFQMAIDLLQTLVDLLDFVILEDKINLSHIRSVPSNVCQIVYSTFLHCKGSNKDYNIYFDSLNEILLLFKKGQEVHNKFMKVLETNIVFNFLFEDELATLKDVLENLLEVGDILTGMNLKSMTDNWKTYVALIKRYGDDLNKDFEVRKPLVFFTSTIVKHAHDVLSADDAKDSAQTLKVYGFLVKVFLKFCDIFWENLRVFYGDLWSFFVDLYNFSTRQPYFERSLRCVDNSIKSQLFVGFEQFLNKLSYDDAFFQASNFRNKIDDEDNVFGFILVSNVVLNKLLLNNGNETFVNKLDFNCYLECLFLAINKSFACIVSDKTFHFELITSLSSIGLLLNEKQFSDVELTLCKTVMGRNLWSSLIAIDVWCLIISRSSTKYGYDTLCNLIDQSESLLNVNFTQRTEFTNFYNLIRQLYKMQSDEFKMKIIDRYPFESHIYVWRHIGLKNTTNASKAKIDNLLSSLIGLMEKYDLGKCTYSDFVFMCNAMSAVSTIPIDGNYKVDALCEILVKLWTFDANDGVLTDNNNFKIYLHSITKLTNSLVCNLNNKQLIHILQQLKLLSNKDNVVKLLTLDFFNSFAKKYKPLNSQDMIFSLASELFNSLLTDNVVIIRQQALQVFANFLDTTSDEDFIHNTLKSKNLQDAVSNFLRKYVPDDVNFGEYFKRLEDKKFRHQCLQSIGFLPKFKKIKLESAETSYVLQKIKKEVQYFERPGKRDDLTEENVSDIKFIVDQLSNLL